jgi:hypothetical protein
MKTNKYAVIAAISITILLIVVIPIIIGSKVTKSLSANSSDSSESKNKIAYDTSVFASVLRNDFARDKDAAIDYYGGVKFSVVGNVVDMGQDADGVYVKLDTGIEQEPVICVFDNDYITTKIGIGYVVSIGGYYSNYSFGSPELNRCMLYNFEKPENKPVDSSITLLEYNSIQKGYKYEKVCSVVGGYGKLLSESGDNEHKWTMYYFEGVGETGCNAVFAL